MSEASEAKVRGLMGALFDAVEQAKVERRSKRWVGNGGCAASTSGTCLHLLQGFGPCDDECVLTPDKEPDCG